MVRLGPGDRGAPGVTRLKRAANEADPLLRPALELALMVARAGEEARPPESAPRALRHLLGFAKVPAKALSVARRVLDEDDEFRSRVAAAADTEGIGRAAWLFLTRPEGWEVELADLQSAAAEGAAAEQEEQAERSAQRRLGWAEEGRRRAEESAAQARSQAAAAADELATERRARRTVEDQLVRVQDHLDGLRGERDDARRRAEQALDEIAGLRRVLAARDAELADLRAQFAARSREADELRAEAASRDSPTAIVGESVAETVAGTVAAAVADAAQAAQRLGQALAAASAELDRLTPGRSHGGVGPGGGAGADQGNGGGPGVADTAAESRAGRRGHAGQGSAPGRGRQHRSRSGANPRRTPVSLPPAVFDDSVEAAEYLVRVPGTVLLVDGYNASLSCWPDLSITEQRRRLVDALAELGSRTGADVHVVFDGADQPSAPPPASGRPLVRCSFSPPEVEADDVILDLVDTAPAHRPVLVASSDRRVQDGARQKGARAIGTPQLLALLRRER